jgi:hypothetical protein
MERSVVPDLRRRGPDRPQEDREHSSVSPKFANLLVLPVVLGFASAAAAQHVGAVPGVISLELAGRSLHERPFFSFERSFFQGTIVSCAIDPALHPSLLGVTGDLYVVAHKNVAEWQHDRTLHDVRGGAQVIQIGPGGIHRNQWVIDRGGLSGFAGPGLGVGYDVVIDFDRDGLLSSGDHADGTDDIPGFWVLYPTAMPGPYAVTEVIYSGGSLLGQDLYYPTNIAQLGELPVVVVSHGNGHNYTWYDHIGYHLASYGCIVMSHTNNTGPGVESASLTTLSNTEYLLANTATIAGGALQGHMDRHHIGWFGHSRGGEGVVRAYDRIVDGLYAPVNFGLGDISFISSIAPTDFLGPSGADPHSVPYSLWTGGADDDVNGCADCDICQTYHLHDRATGTRQSIMIQGVGHGAFHSGSASLFAAGPCQISRADTNVLMQAYMLPLAKAYFEGNQVAKDCFWRPWSTFHSPGTSESVCVKIDLMYRPGPGSGDFVIDDFQTQTATTTSSSGGSVSFDVDALTEGRLDDITTDFTANASDPMNGMTNAGPGDISRGIVFEWTGADRLLSFGLVPAAQDVRPWDYVSFRACQATRHVDTLAVFTDLTFSIRLVDQSGHTSTLPLSSYGGGVGEPYLRGGCGGGFGWANTFATLRVRLADFRTSDPGLDLEHIQSVDFLFGPSYGSNEGRIGFDDVTLSH